MNYTKIFKDLDCDYKNEIIEVLEYSFNGKGLNELIDFMEDGINHSGAIDELIDGAIDIYYHDLRKWAVDNYEYIEEALKEFGTSGDWHKDIQMGQYLMYQEDYNECIHDMIKHIKDNYNV